MGPQAHVKSLEVENSDFFLVLVEHSDFGFGLCALRLLLSAKRSFPWLVDRLSSCVIHRLGSTDPAGFFIVLYGEESEDGRAERQGITRFSQN